MLHRVNRSTFAAGLLLATVAAANPYLEEGRRLYDGLRFSEAISQLLVARAVPNASVAERVETLDLLGRSLIAEGRLPEAEEAFTALLTLAPSTELDPSLSPKILEVFTAVKVRLYPEGYVLLRPLSAPPRVVRVALLDPWRQVAQVTAELRTAEGWRPLATTEAEGTWTAQLPPLSTGEPQWAFEARSPAGKVLARIEGPPRPAVAEPLSAAVGSGPARAEAGVHQGAPLRRSAAWAATATAVVAGVAGGIMQYRSAAAVERREGTEWVDQGRAWDRRAQSDARWAAGLFVGAGAAAVTATALWVF